MSRGRDADEEIVSGKVYDGFVILRTHSSETSDHEDNTTPKCERASGSRPVAPHLKSGRVGIRLLVRPVCYSAVRRRGELTHGGPEPRGDCRFVLIDVGKEPKHG